MKQDLGDLRLFKFAVDSRLIADTHNNKDCKVMDSKKLPLNLVLNNQQNLYSQIKTQEIKILFKCGDDIRQDSLSLQMIKIMDKIWLDAGMDFRMNAYRVTPTDD